MLDEVDNVLYEWKNGYINTEVAEQKILDLVLDYDQRKKQFEKKEGLRPVLAVINEHED